VNLFVTFSPVLKLALKIGLSYTPYWILSNKFGGLLPTYGNFESKCAQNSSKRKNIFYKSVLDSNFTTISASVFSMFSKIH
jgi:hypothetical protein